MKPELQKYYEARFDMMASQGWKDLIEDIQVMATAYDKVERIKEVEAGKKRASTKVTTKKVSDASSVQHGLPDDNNSDVIYKANAKQCD